MCPAASAHFQNSCSLDDHIMDGLRYRLSCVADGAVTDPSTIEALVQLAGQQVNEIVSGGLARLRTLERIKSMLASRDLQMVYQPAIRLDTSRIEFVEALARFRSEPYETPDRWMTAAAEVGLGSELELLAVRRGLEELNALPAGVAMSVNVSPSAIVSSDLLEQLASAPLERVIVELTEHQPVDCYSAVLEALAPLREKGLRIAVDDAGAGFASFRHVLHIRPDIIKLDMSLSRGIDSDSAKRALTSALIRFARQIGSNLVAEGVETAEELAILRDLGVDIVQGHIVARPSSSGCISARSASVLKQIIPLNRYRPAEKVRQVCSISRSPGARLAG